MVNKKDKKFKGQKRPEREFDQRLIDLARVTRVMAGGKRMRFRACVALGDHKGRCGIGLAKGADVTIAINKAVNQAKKKMITVPIVNETIPHRLYLKKGAAKLLLKPAPKGTGVKAGGAIRVVLELAGVPNITGKILGTNNKVNNVKALIQALASFKQVEPKKKKPAHKPEPKQKENKQKSQAKEKIISDWQLKKSKL